MLLKFGTLVVLYLNEINFKIYSSFFCLMNTLQWVSDSVNKLHRSRSETIGSHTILGDLGVWSCFWGYLATPAAKPDVIFLLGDHDFLQRRRNYAPISLSFRDMPQERQTTDDRHGDRNRIMLSHCKCASLVSSVLSGDLPLNTELILLRVWNSLQGIR